MLAATSQATAQAAACAGFAAHQRSNSAISVAAQSAAERRVCQRAAAWIVRFIELEPIRT
jgi:hypothetical protein